jgi:hypothetical protein
MSIVMTAREVPEIRARMASWARDPDSDGAPPGDRDRH